jgi:hypothetical protein
MATIITRAGKGSPLENDEVDANFTNLNDDKLEATDLVAADTSYDNTDSGLVASNVQSAIDEIEDKKLNISDMASNVSFYATTTASDIATYNKLVTTPEDVDFDDTAVNVSTGSISTTNQLISSLASVAGILSGATGIINISTIGNIRKTSGSGTADFYFEVYKRDSGGTETLIGTSSATDAIDNSVYEQFNATSLISSTSFADTDRVVLKFYANRLSGGSNPVYEFQFGGDIPVRTNFPVPVNVVSHPNDAEDIIVDTANFAGILNGSDNSVQNALDTIDDHTHPLTQFNITATATELNYTDGVTSSIQTQLDSKAPLASPTFTGTVTADGVTIGSSTITETASDLTISATDDLLLEANGNRVFQAWDNGSLQYVLISNGNQNLAQFDPNGDISFYEDTGTTPKFFWDASAERLGLGTSSPSSSLTIREESANHEIIEISRPASDVGALYIGTVGTNDAAISANNSNLTFGIAVSGVYAEKMRIDSSGTLIHKAAAIFNEDGGNSDFRVESDTDTHALFVDASSGNIGINTNNPTANLQIFGSSSATTGLYVYGFSNTANTAWLNGHNGNSRSAKLKLGNGSYYVYSQAEIEFSSGWGDLGTHRGHIIRSYGTTNSVLKFLRLDRDNSTETDVMYLDDNLTVSNSLVVNKSMVVNQEGGDYDFRVESDTRSAMLFVDASTDRVGINTDAPQQTLEVRGKVLIEANNAGLTDPNNELILSDSDTTTATDQLMGAISFNTKDASNPGTAAKIQTRATNSLGSGELQIWSGTAPTLAKNAMFRGDQVVFNEDSNDMDFRVESNTNTHALFVNAENSRVGVGTNDTSADVSLTVAGSMRVQSYNTNDAFINLAVGATAASTDQLYTIRIDNDVSNSFEIDDNTDGSEFFRYTPSVGIILNEESKSDNDFRVESDSNTHALFVDASTNRVVVGSSGSKTLFNVIDATAAKIAVQNTTNTGSMGLFFYDENDTEQTYFNYDMPSNRTYLAFNGNGLTLYGKQVSAPITEIGVSGNYRTLTHYGSAVFNENSGDYDFRVESDTSTHALFVDAGNSRVGIHTTSPATTFDVRDSTAPIVYLRSNTNIAKGDNIGVIQSAATLSGSFTGTGFAKIQFESESSGGGARAGTGISFYTNLDGYAGTTDREVVRIDRSGNLLVGKNSSSFSIAGHSILSSGYVGHTRDGGNPVTVNRLTSDGSLVNFEKDGATVGSIGSRSAGLYLEKTNTKIVIYDDGTTNAIFPEVSSDPTDLGLASYPFRRLYLSAGVYLGGTGAANNLDDYEEGTFTPVYSSTGLSVTHDTQSGSYTKIGNTVFFTLFIGTDVVSGGSGSQLTITGLPYAANSPCSGIVGLAYTFNASENDTKWVIISGQAAISFYTGTSNGAAVLPSSALATYNNANRLYMSGTYKTT